MIPEIPLWAGCVTIAVSVSAIVSFLRVSFTDPGYIKSKGRTLQELYEKYSGDFVCPYCVVKKPHWAKHCAYCKRCVRRYDHHCPWINNCVGRGNHKWFLAFIIITQFDFLIIGLESLAFAFTDLGGTGLWPRQFAYLDSDVPYIALGVAILSFICFLVVLPLFYVTISNACKNTTTSQRFGHKKNSQSMVRHSKNSTLPDLSDESDTQSMLLREDDDSEFSLFSEGQFESSSKHTTVTTGCLCWKRKNVIARENNESLQETGMIGSISAVNPQIKSLSDSEYTERHDSKTK